MSVDWFSCSKCDHIFCDCGSFVCCDDCGEYLCFTCADNLGISEGMAAEKDEDFDACPFCNKVVFTDEDVLSWALGQLRSTRKWAEDKMREC